MFSAQADLEVPPGTRLCFSSITNSLSERFLLGAVRIFWPPLFFWTPWNEINMQWKKTTVFRRNTPVEQIEFDYPAAKRHITKKAHIGVVGSGDMEVLMEPAQSEGANVS